MESRASNLKVLLSLLKMISSSHSPTNNPTQKTQKKKQKQKRFYPIQKINTFTKIPDFLLFSGFISGPGFCICFYFSL